MITGVLELALHEPFNQLLNQSTLFVFRSEGESTDNDWEKSDNPKSE